VPQALGLNVLIKPQVALSQTITQLHRIAKLIYSPDLKLHVTIEAPASEHGVEPDGEARHQRPLSEKVRTREGKLAPAGGPQAIRRIFRAVTVARSRNAGVAIHEDAR
jgi:hypothetical protein